MSDTAASSRTDRVDFQATSDPAVLETADRGEANLLDLPPALLAVGAPAVGVQDLDFTQDRIDWHERIDAEERYARMYGLSSFFIGEQRVAAELGPMMRARRRGHAHLPLHADRRRGAPRRLLRPLLQRGRRARVRGLDERLAETSEHLNPEFGTLFDELLKRRVDRLAVEPEDLEALVEAVTIYHMVIEGMLALTGQHFIIDYNEREGTLPGFVEGFTNVARDEHRHVAFGARFLREMAREDPRYVTAIQRTLGRGRADRRGRAEAEVGARRRGRRAVRRQRSPRRARSRSRRSSAA